MKMEFTLSIDEENALTLFEELERTDINPTNLNVNCCCGLLRTSPFHLPKSNSKEHLPHGDHQHRHSPAQSGHRNHDHATCEDVEDTGDAGIDPSGKRRWRSNVERRNNRYRTFGLLESSILNSFQIQNFRRKTPSVFESSSSSGQTSCSSTTSSMIEDISDKIDEIDKLDSNIHSLMYKSVELHNDLLSLEATTNRLIADTRKLSDDLDDVQFLDELIAILNGDIGPVIHREWPYKVDTDAPIEEGTPVT